MKTRGWFCENYVNCLVKLIPERQCAALVKSSTLGDTLQSVTNDGDDGVDLVLFDDQRWR